MKKQNRHFSHPHALEPVENEEEDDDKEICCVVCEQQLSTNNEPSYFCPIPDCEFYIHKSCSELPKTLDHKSHPDHKLKLLSEPPYYRIYYDCNACGDLINAFSYHCRRQQDDDESCDIKLHPKCAFLPDTVDCKVHDLHAPLAIQHHTPPKTSSKGSDEFDDIVSCGVCDGIVTEGYWSYFCKDCDFVTHLDCAFSADVAAEEVNEEEEEEEINEEEEEEINEEEEEEEINEEEEEEEEEEEINEEEEEEINEEEETNEEGEEEDGELSDAMRLHVANIQAMEQNARLQFQMQMAEMNARAIAMLFRTTI